MLSYYVNTQNQHTDMLNPYTPITHYCPTSLSYVVVTHWYHTSLLHTINTHHYPTQNIFFARLPYANQDLGAGPIATRFIGLAAVGNTRKEKFLHALQVTPAAHMDATQLVALPGMVWVVLCSTHFMDWYRTHTFCIACSLHSMYIVSCTHMQDTRNAQHTSNVQHRPPSHRGVHQVSIRHCYCTAKTGCSCSNGGGGVFSGLAVAQAQPTSTQKTWIGAVRMCCYCGSTQLVLLVYLDNVDVTCDVAVRAHIHTHIHIHTYTSLLPI